MNDLFCCRWDSATWLVLRGSDAAIFLQGQFTNELRRQGPGGCTYGLWLNQKGKVLADGFVVKRESDVFEVLSLTSPAATIRKRLEAYIIADDVEVEDATLGSVGWIVSGAVLDHLGVARPEVGQFAESAGAIVFRARAAGTANWYLGVRSGQAPAWIDRMNALGTTAVANELTRDRIAAGLPEIPVDLGPGDLPNEGGLEQEAISFTKGCYLGQEVMARLHNMGQVRRRLFIVEALGGAASLETGCELFKRDKRVGDVRSIVVDRAEPAIALAMLHTTHVSLGDELANTPDGSAVIRIRALAEGRAW